ncbi:hypothetical protein SDRG_17447, partial [Saprolegnia diclina VS20]
MALYSATHHQDKDTRRVAALEAQLRISHPFRRPTTTKSQRADRVGFGTRPQDGNRTSASRAPSCFGGRDREAAAHDHVLELAHRVLRRDDTISALREKFEHRVARKKAEVQHIAMHLVDANATIAKNKTTILLLHTAVKSLK